MLSSETHDSLLKLADNLVAQTQTLLHQKLAEISKKCHQLKAEGKEKEIQKLEKENDELAKKLFSKRRENG